MYPVLGIFEPRFCNNDITASGMYNCKASLLQKEETVAPFCELGTKKHKTPLLLKVEQKIYRKGSD